MHGDAEATLEQLLEVHLAPRGDAHDVIDDAARGIDHRGHADTDRRHLPGHDPPDEGGDMVHDLPLGAVGFAGLGFEPLEAAVAHQADTHVGAAQVHTDSHLVFHHFLTLVILPPAKRTRSTMRPSRSRIQVSNPRSPSQSSSRRTPWRRLL